MERNNGEVDRRAGSSGNGEGVEMRIHDGETSIERGEEEEEEEEERGAEAKKCNNGGRVWVL